MPLDLDCYAMSIRGLWIQYDHYSDQGSSFFMPDVPQEYRMNEGINHNNHNNQIDDE